MLIQVRLETLCGCHQVISIPPGLDEWRVALYRESTMVQEGEIAEAPERTTRTFRWTGGWSEGLPMFREVD